MVNINFEVFRFQSSSGSNIVKSCEQENSATTDLQSERVLTEIKTTLKLILCLVAYNTSANMETVISTCKIKGMASEDKYMAKVIMNLWLQTKYTTGQHDSVHLAQA